MARGLVESSGMTTSLPHLQTHNKIHSCVHTSLSFSIECSLVYIRAYTVVIPWINLCWPSYRIEEHNCCWTWQFKRWHLHQCHHQGLVKELKWCKSHQRSFKDLSSYGKRVCQYPEFISCPLWLICWCPSWPLIILSFQDWMMYPEQVEIGLSLSLH